MAAPILDPDESAEPQDSAVTVDSLLQITNHAQDHNPNLIGPNNPRPGPPSASAVPPYPPFKTTKGK